MNTTKIAPAFHKALIKEDKSFFDERSFVEVYEFLRRLRPHYFYYSGLKKYLIPKIKIVDELKLTASIYLSKSAWESIIDLYLSKFEHLNFTTLLFKQCNVPTIPAKSYYRDHPTYFKSFLDHMSSENDFLGILMYCEFKENMVEAITSWWERLVKPDITKSYPKSVKPHELRGIITETKLEATNIMNKAKNENIRLAAAYMEIEIEKSFFSYNSVIKRANNARKVFA